MNFTEVVNEVVDITKRPDKIKDIRREVNAAINFFSVETNFARDRSEQSVAIDATIYAQSIPLSVLTRFRKVDVIKPSGRCSLSNKEPSNIFTRNPSDATNVWYLAGNQINISTDSLNATLLLAYYSFPPILTDIAPDYWMLEVSPFMVIDRAASKIFANIGDDSSMKVHKGFADEAYISAKRDYKYGVNYG